MRIFDVYYYNIANTVKFKDTAKYISTMLEQLGLGYKEISFTYNGFLTSVGQMLEKYPNLTKYCYPYEPFSNEELLTSLVPGWIKGNYYADKADWKSIFDIASKCPRGMNITGKIVLDQIDWYGEGTKAPCIKVRTHSLDAEKAEIVDIEPILNSQIVIGRDYSDGNKRNSVKVVVEITSKEDLEPRDSSAVVEKLEPYLGKPEGFKKVCRGSLEEETDLQEKMKDCDKRLKQYIENVFPNEYRGSSMEDEFILNIADKKKINAAFKKTDFKMGDRKGLLPGMNRLIGYDSANHQYEILFDRTQNSPNYFYWYVYIRGYNFTFESNQNRAYAYSEEEGTTRLFEIADFCQKMLHDFEPVVTENFGLTPEWYCYAK